MDVMHSRLYLCLKAASHLREIALIKYTGWLLSHLVPVSSAWKEDTKKRLWRLQEAWMSFSHSLGYVYVRKSGIRSFAIFLLPYLLHLRSQGLLFQAKSIQSVWWELSRESLNSRSQSSPGRKLPHLLIGKEQIAPVVLALESGGLGGIQNMTRASEAKKWITARKSLLTWPPSVSSSGL